MLTAEEIAERRNRAEARKRPWGVAPAFIWRALPKDERKRIKAEIMAELEADRRGRPGSGGMKGAKP